MAFITLSGTLLDPNGDLAVGDQIRFTHKSTTGETVESAVSLITVNPAGTYSLPLQYGLVLVEYKDVRTQQFKNLGVATVNSDNPATSIPELLNALVPVSSAELIEFQGILADCVTAQAASEASAAAALVSENAAAASAATIDLINDLSQAYIFDTVAEYQASTIVFPVGKTIHLNDRDADFTKITGTGTANTFNIIASTSVNQSIDLVDIENPVAYGLLPNGSDSPLGAAQEFYNTCVAVGATCDFSNGSFRIDQVNLSPNSKIRSTGGTIKPHSTLGAVKVFIGINSGLDIAVNYETDNNLTGLLGFGGGVSPLPSVTELKVDCTIHDSGNGSLTESAIELLCRLQAPVIKVKGTALNKNDAMLVHNPHGTGDDTLHADLDIDIHSVNWASAFIHEGTGYATGINKVNCHVENAKGLTGAVRTSDVFSSYHMRNLSIRRFRSVNCDRVSYLWKIQAADLLYNIGYTGANADDTEEAPILIEAMEGSCDSGISIGSAFDGIRCRWGGQINFKYIYGEGNAGYPFVAKYDLAGQSRIDLNILSYYTFNNGKGSILVERLLGTASDGLRSVKINNGQSIENNTSSGAHPDIHIKGAGEGIRLDVNDCYSDGDCDSAVTVDGDGNYALVQVRDSDLLSSGANTISITGASGGGRRIIRDNAVDDRTKMSIGGGSGVKLFHQNYGATQGDIADGVI